VYYFHDLKITVTEFCYRNYVTLDKHFQLIYAYPFVRVVTLKSLLTGCYTLLDLDLESNRKTPGRNITPMEMKGGATEDDA